jgi:predicted amidohydrolase YtcJ
VLSAERQYQGISFIDRSVIMQIAERPRVLFLNGNVLTLDSEESRYEALAVEGDRIFALGSSREIASLRRAGDQEVDLQGKTLMPGFIDVHCHTLSFGLNLKTWVGVQDVTTVEEIQERLAERVRVTRPGEWIKGRGWCKGVLGDRLPTRYDLDQVAPDNPVVIIDATGHMSVVNSYALRLHGVTRETDFGAGGKIDKDPRSGEPTGILREHATYYIGWMKGQTPTEEELLEAARMMCLKAAKTGITTLHSIMIRFPSEEPGKMGYSPSEIRPFFTMERRGELPIRVWLKIQAYQFSGKGEDHTFVDRLLGLGMAGHFGNERLRIGTVKILCDGAIMANTGAMREPYSSDPETRGIINYNQEQLNALVLKAHRAGFQVEIHAHGDRAIDLTLNAYEYALGTYPRKDHRHIITHARVLHDEQIEKIVRLGLIVNGVPGVNGWEQSRLRVEAGNVGDNRARLLSRLRTLIDRGIIVAGGSDCHPCHPYGPLHFIQAAVTPNTYSFEAPLTVKEAFRLWTTNAAYESWEEELKGSLTPGKLADMVVLADNPFRVAPNRIETIAVEETWVGGQKVAGE